MRVGIVLAVLAVVAIAGCLSSPGAPPADAGVAGGAAWAVQYVCGPGHEIPLAGGCMGRIDGGSRTLGEPQVALHPTDPLTFAIAVSDGRRPDALAQDLPSLEPRGLAVYVTQDGGASFARHAIDLQQVGDLPYNPGLMGADPAVAFTPDGMLHLAGLIVTGSAGTPSNPVSLQTTLFAMRSSDLGATWETPVVLDDAGSNDREWLAASPEGDLVVTWRDHTLGHSKFATGQGGLSESTEGVGLESCRQVSNAVWLDGVALVGCQEGSDLRVYELSDPPTPRGVAAGGCPSNSARMTATVTGALVASCYYGSVAISLDGGWNWTRVFDLFEKTTLDDGWDAGIGPNIFALGADARGMVHFTLSRFPVQQDQQPNGDGRPVAHVVLDPGTGEVLHAQELQGESSGDGPLGYGFADDFYGIDFAADRGILVWTSSDWSTHFVLLDVQ